MKREGKRSKIIKERRRNRIIAAVVLILLVLIVAMIFIWLHKKKTEEEPAGEASTATTEIAPIPEETASEATTEEAAAEATKEEEKEELPTDRAMQELETELKEYISQKPGKWSLYLERVDSGEKIEIDASEKMRSASLIKLYVAGCCLEDLEKEKIEQNKEEILAKIEKMIKVSDNESCNELIDLMGFDRINEFIKEQNCTSTEIARKMLEQSENDNYTSAADCASVLKNILEGKYVSEEASGTLLEYLKGQEFVTKIPKGVPEGVITANKTGELNNVQNDAAIVYAPGGTYILCVMSENENGAFENEGLIAEISTMVYGKIGEKEQTEAGSESTKSAASEATTEAPAEEGASKKGASGEGAAKEGTSEEGAPGERTSEEKKENDQAVLDTGTGTTDSKPLPIDEKIKAMSLEDKISYLVMPSPEEFVSSEIDTATVTQVGDATRKCLEKVPGVVGFSLSGSNVENKEQFTALINDAKSTRAEMPMAFLLSEGTIKNDHMLEKLGVDEGTDLYLNPLLKIGSYEDASRAGSLMAKFLSEYGVNIYVLPDLTVITDEQIQNEDTDVIGGYMEGLRNSGINVCASYFPGKSDKKDSNQMYSSDKKGIVINDKDAEIMKHAVDLGAEMIMVPACRYPEILPGGELAFMSKTVIRDMIRDELGFEGVIITDALSSEQLGGISSAEAAVAALENGADMIYMPDDYEAVLAGIKEAVDSKKLSEERINESAQRVYNMLVK